MKVIQIMDNLELTAVSTALFMTSAKHNTYLVQMSP